jgi:hypothetical protein
MPNPQLHSTFPTSWRKKDFYGFYNLGFDGRSARRIGEGFSSVAQVKQFVFLSTHGEET